MVQKNIDLELQALRLVQQKLGHSPEAYQPGASDDQEVIEKMKKSNRLADEEDERILQEVLEQSKKEYERQRSQDEEEMQKRLELAKRESLKSIEVPHQKEEQEAVSSLQHKPEVSSSLPAELHGKEVKKDSEREISEVSKSLPSAEVLRREHDKEALPSLTSTKTTPGKTNDTGEVSDAASLWLESAKADIGKGEATAHSKLVIAHVSSCEYTSNWCSFCPHFVVQRLTNMSVMYNQNLCPMNL